MTNYLPEEVKGIPEARRAGVNTRKGSPRNHIYRVEINGIVYYKVHFHRDQQSVIKYFKKRKDAKACVEILRELFT